MKSKLVFWGTNAQDEKLLIALRLRAEDNVVDMYTFSQEVATEAFYQQLMDDWRNGKDIEFPAGHKHEERRLSVTESLLPEDIKVERGDIIQRAQTEWHFAVLSNKLSQVYQSELEDIKGKIKNMKAFDRNVWDELKNFWDKVQEQSREKNLLREHVNDLKSTTNELFTELKEMRNKLDAEFKQKSQEYHQGFMGTLQDIEQKIEEGKLLKPIFEQLKDLQRQIKDVPFTRKHRNEIWEKIDKSFKAVKEKRFGKAPEGQNTASGRVDRRLQGLLSAIEKMERSIQRDKQDLAFQGDRIEKTSGQLEAQIRQAKIAMIEERIRSKEEKYEDMLKTKAQLEQKLTAEQAREEKRKAKAEEDKKRQAAAVAAKEKIAAEIKTSSAAIEGEAAEKLKEAAEAIKKQQQKSKQPPKADPVPEAESILSAVGATLGESLEDVMDTVKAVAAVVGDKIEESVNELRDTVFSETDAKEEGTAASEEE